MLFRQKEKVPDVGRDNFRDFMKREKTSVKMVNDLTISRPSTLNPFKSQSVSNNNYSKSSTATNQPTLDPLQLIKDGSCKASGNTWDAQHLDLFLTSSKYATRETYMDTIKQEALLANNNGGVKESFYFRNKWPRFQEEKNANNLVFATKYNHLVTRPDGQHQLDEETRLSFIEQKLMHVPENQIDKKTLQYTPNPDNINESRDLYQVTLPKEKREKLKESKKQQEEFKKMREEFFAVNRAHRTAKAGFKSGILNIDNPEMPNTVIYQQEQKNLCKKQKRSEIAQQTRLKMLQKFNQVNPSIEYDNSQFAPINEIVTKNDFLLTKNAAEFPSSNYEFDKSWAQKKMVNEQFIQERQNTADRIFGNNLNQIKAHTTTQRAMFLRSQELRGRNFDMISLTRNDLQQQQ